MSTEAVAPTQETKLEKVARLRRSENRKVMSEFIRIGTSDLYDGQPGVRATLREVAFLQVNDENAEYPEKAPQSFKDTRVGWCYASQAYIGLRVGLTEGQIQRNIQTFIEDKVIDVRSYIDSDGWHHNEYHVLEQVVTDRQRPENIKEALENRPKRNKRDYKNYNNKGAFKPGNKARKGTVVL
jgi:hypothetical protein